ncbi:probable folate-biopterin transporter 8, chloroplastic isoform X1 [Solanum pennellii]|uniref:Probable folate-biopterin transporter 8, chloroplastic isoform X1 n=1 Tax=Solanum pennellii TaxID=28526 RepID=A0ABM1HKH0_SOLPN|nr:probable folate-biopterin transporter 8, chloroplastic isoform X1 [Solanum pennellii]
MIIIFKNQKLVFFSNLKFYSRKKNTLLLRIMICLVVPSGNVQDFIKIQSLSCCQHLSTKKMTCSVVSRGNPLLPNVQKFRKIQSLSCCQQQNSSTNNTIDKQWKPKSHLIKILEDPQVEKVYSPKVKKKMVFEEKNGGLSQMRSQYMAILCGVGYWVQGFRCFPWLGLNFHMANGMNMHPSTLQLVQYFGILPMVAKPIFGILSDAVYIGGAHRIPYISLGVLLQVLAWGQLALTSAASEAIPALMACVLLSNVGASITEVAKDALVAEYGKKHRMPGLQSYAFMASAAGGILGNLIGGYFLLKTQQPKLMFLAFSALLALQLVVTSATREESLGLAQSSNYSVVREPITEIFRKQYSDLMVAATGESIARPLIWIVMSILAVPVLSGSIFCYQTQCLNLDPSVIGMSKVIGQLLLLSLTVFYDRYGKRIPMRKLIGIVQITYAASLLLDLVLVKQLNLKLGISNEWFALCFSGLAETIAIFKLLPFHVLFASLAPSGFEGSLMSFLASALCFSSVFSGVLGVSLATFLGLTPGNYSSLHIGILIQFVAALLPLRWLSYVPMAQPAAEKGKKRGQSKRTRKYRRVGRVVVDSFYSYRRIRESDFDENPLLTK